MVAPGEVGHYLLRREDFTGLNPIKVAGGWAVIRAYLDATEAYRMLGFSMTENSQSWGYELHWQSPYDVPLPHQTNPWCQGAVYSAEGSIRATGQDSIPIEVRLGSIRSSIKEEPDPAENLEALAIARLLYAEKHVFDPNVHPLLNLAARKIGITS